MNHPPNTSLARLLCEESRFRLLDEGFRRIERCVRLLSEEQLWRRGHTQMASPGNLILHLAGNVRQWVVSGMGAEADERDRDSEFEAQGPIPAPELLDALRASLKDAERVMADLSESDLTKDYSIQGFNVSGVSILVHVVEHFSYHVGQITFMTKLWTESDTGYYAGLNLNAKNPAD